MTSRSAVTSAVVRTESPREAAELFIAVTRTGYDAVRLAV